jgi:hypothetical protein
MNMLKNDLSNPFLEEADGGFLVGLFGDGL